MTYTRCRVASCVYHHPDDLCGADRICVSWHTPKACCGTFHSVNEAAEYGEEDDTLGLAGSITHENNPMEPLVACQVTSCFYYSDMSCFARQILVTGEQAQHTRDTQCATYAPDENSNGNDPEYAENANHLGHYYL